MIHIPDNISSIMSVLVGSISSVSDAPTEIFHQSRIEFLAQLSRRLLADPRVKALPDVVSFAYWSRKANLIKLQDRFLKDGRLRMGLGLIFHICPSNVPVNFAFSMAFGLLSGNTCLLRLPSKSSLTADLLVEVIRAQLEDVNHKDVHGALTLVRFERDDDINRFWMSKADGRIIWGGDETIRHMRAFVVKPRSREVAFPDRYSLCVIEPISILQMNEQTLIQFCNSLFNDIYVMDQAACSSPQLLVWIGEQEDVKNAQDRLWPLLVKIAEQKYTLQPVQVIDKFVQACRHAIGNSLVSRVERHDNILYRLELESINSNQDECRGYFGTIHEVILSDLNALAPIVNERYQTLTIQGIQNTIVSDWIVRHGLRGIDRVVPVGRALDMDIVWDGYDIVNSLSRLIAV